MSDAPETIWAFYTPDDFDDDAIITAYETTQHGGAKYLRADLPLTTAQLMADLRVKSLVDALENILSELDWTETKPFTHEVKGRNAIAKLKEPKE